MQRESAAESLLTDMHESITGTCRQGFIPILEERMKPIVHRKLLYATSAASVPLTANVDQNEGSTLTPTAEEQTRYERTECMSQWVQIILLARQHRFTHK
jgi:hypothetical protein